MSARQDTRKIGRRKPSKTPRLHILLVCEGEKTEPSYFAHFKRKLRLSNIHIDICGAECGSDPRSVVTYAGKRFKQDTSIDKCFCIIDRDSHETNNFNSAVSMAKALDLHSKSRSFITHVSDPCIEYWFLLHFEYTRSPFAASGAKSRADSVIGRLVELWPEYRKNLNELGDALEGRTDQACENAAKALHDAENTGETNPSTSIHLLVDELKQAGT